MTREQQIEQAIEILKVWLARSQGCAFTADFFGACVYKDNTFLPTPPDYRFLGAVFQRAKRQGLIRQSGAFVTTRSKHRSPLWIAA